MTVEAINQQVSELRVRLPKVEAAHGAAQQMVEEADGRRVRLAYELHVMNNQAVNPELERTVVDYDSALRVARDTEIAVNQIHARFRELETEREEAQRGEHEAELRQVSAHLRASGRRLDAALETATVELGGYLELSYRGLNLLRKLKGALPATPKAIAAHVLATRFAPLLHPVLDLPRLGNHPDLTTFEAVGRIMGAQTQEKNDDGARSAADNRSPRRKREP